MKNKKLTQNNAKGRTSFDSTSTGQLIEFFNKNVMEYPTDVGAVKFDLVPVKKQKDLILNTARLNAQQEYNRILSLVNLLQKQAADLKRRLDVTDLVYHAEYKFKIFPGNVYYLVKDNTKNKTLLLQLGPNDWSTGKPDHYTYIANVKCLGDLTWIEVDQQGEPLPQ